MDAIAYQRLSSESLLQRWRELLRDPNAPERCELDEFGEVHVTPPPSFRHQRIVAAVGRQIEAQLGGEAGSYALATSIGVRFPDVCWAPSFNALAQAGGADPLTQMPPICVEVVSPSNSRKEMNEKIAAYLEAGAEEVILVEQDDRVRFFHQDSEHSQSLFKLVLHIPV